MEPGMGYMERGDEDVANLKSTRWMVQRIQDEMKTYIKQGDEKSDERINRLKERKCRV